ncbi:MAG: glycoside hydrolase [Acidobacteriia bacterium]|nr:glycoside hydrolase [Terriglobia bacterium]
MRSRYLLQAVVAGVLGSALYLAAAVASSGTLTAPPAGQTSSIAWAGGPYTGVTADPSACTTLTCDSFMLTVNVPSTFYASNPTYAVRVRIAWAASTNDFDLYVYDSSGALVASSAQGGTTFEDADAGALPSGTYRVQVVAFAAVNASYTGSATLGPEPTTTTGRARYRNGDFTFSAPQALPGPADLLFTQQGVEPRAVTDPLGNIYVASIQGIPAGTDAWKSMDGGQTFAYLGQPDGAQAASAIARGGGAGGGDEDLAAGSSGNVYVTSLWLGSATQASSSNGGATWTANPFSTDAPLTDRQWIAAHGAGELYLTYKQLGVLLANTESIFVAKSFDGGVTFPQIVEVTTPEFGVQPGLQGNIEVDPNTGTVYNAFVGAQENQLYLARSTDGGRTFILKLILQAASGTSLGNVFPSLGIDRGGNLHVAYSDGRNIFLTSSADGGATWTPPVRVSNGAATKTSLAPWVQAGDAGKVNIAWWGTSASSNLDAGARWQVLFAQTQNAFANVPTFSQAAATAVMHAGAICVNGTACPSGTRNLAEYFAQGLWLDGSALIPYPDDFNNPSPMTTFVRQTGGARITGIKN